MEWESNMDFGQFVERVCQHLINCHNWTNPKERLVNDTSLLTPIYEGYQFAMAELQMDSAQTRGVFERVDWPAHIQTTSYKVNEKHNA